MYKIVLDIFSGRENPSFDISEMAFNNLYAEIKVQKINPKAVLYEGLGFKGFILTNSKDKYIFIQKNIAKIELSNQSQYFDIDSKTFFKCVELFNTHDSEKQYSELINQCIKD
jgi:hypothetical protein